MTEKIKPMGYKQCNTYVRSHGVELPNGQVMLTKPLFVFKKIKGSGWGNHRIANLVIPIGAVVNLAQDDNKKMRASQAYCHSIYDTNGKTEYSEGISGGYTHNTSTYRSGKKRGLTVRDFKNITIDAEKYQDKWTSRDRTHALIMCKVAPNSFDTGTSTCAGGIHFFVEVSSAKNYCL